MSNQHKDVSDVAVDVPRLEIDSIIGLNGKVHGGMKVHPNRQHLIFPLGCAVVIEDISTNKQESLWGHTDYVTCIGVSNSGKYIASGQRTHMGFKAEVIIWDYEKRKAIHALTLHKVKVEAVAFSPNDLYLATLGGKDDGSVVIWNVATGESICGHPAQTESAGNTLCLAFSNINDNVFVTGGDGTLRVWELDLENRKIRPKEVTMGQIKRVITCIEMADDFETETGNPPFFFCGTTTGDVLAINMRTKLFQFLGPEKDKLSLGVTSLALLKTGEFLLGAGDGTLALAKFIKPAEQIKKATPSMKIVKKWKDPENKNRASAITSIALRGIGHQFFVVTDNSQLYKFNFAEFSCELMKTCHSTAVHDICFPYGASELIATCQYEEIRIWELKGKKELRRLKVQNMTCSAIEITRDGKKIVSAWNDGIIRVHGFDEKSNIVERITGGIRNSHTKGVTAVACTGGKGTEDFRIISGGGEGLVRIWTVSQVYNGKGEMIYKDTLVETLKEHKGAVSCIKVKKNDKECVSSSLDGTCIIWDLVKNCRSQIVFANTLFHCVCYSHDECQIITSGTDRKISYWETYDGSMIRDVEGAKTGAINAMDLSSDGQYFVTGGDDKLLKVWDYNEATVKAVGIGHSGNITRVRICPNQKFIVSVSEDGAVIVWKYNF
ncbi:hypothetical protein ACJMK2_033846 [Sinanodonta woodiana]|uniref:Cilia- and flagella-associated protein 52 n=1 Tax=Sinanodonta woodiana TaxID=1069815 RepID=A0ABD3WPN2_SINWO